MDEVDFVCLFITQIIQSNLPSLNLHADINANSQ